MGRRSIELMICSTIKADPKGGVLHHFHFIAGQSPSRRFCCRQLRTTTPPTARAARACHAAGPRRTHRSSHHSRSDPVAAETSTSLRASCPIGASVVLGCQGTLSRACQARPGAEASLMRWHPVLHSPSAAIRLKGAFHLLLVVFTAVLRSVLGSLDRIEDDGMNEVVCLEKVSLVGYRSHVL